MNIQGESECGRISLEGRKTTPVEIAINQRSKRNQKEKKVTVGPIMIENKPGGMHSSGEVVR